MTTTITSTHIETPVGTLRIVVRAGALCALGWVDRWERIGPALEARLGQGPFPEGEDPSGTATAIKAYLAGDVQAIEGIAVDPGGTPFQRRVWEALRRIPAGTTVSYSELARSLGDAAAVRAVAGANARNPVSIVIPCHRVIAKTGELHGYGGGLERKRWLLRNEGAPIC